MRQCRDALAGGCAQRAATREHECHVDVAVAHVLGSPLPTPPARTQDFFSLVTVHIFRYHVFLMKLDKFVQLVLADVAAGLVAGKAAEGVTFSAEKKQVEFDCALRLDSNDSLTVLYGIKKEFDAPRVRFSVDLNLR